MAIASEGNNEPHNFHDDEINLLDLMLVLARRWRMIAGITILAAIVSAGVAMSMPAVYASTANLMVLEFQDKTDALRVGDNAKIVYGKRKGIWKPTDASVIKEVLESTQLKQTVESKLASDRHTVQIKQDKKNIELISVRVEGVNREATTKIAAATVEEGARLAFRMGLLTSPSIILDDELPSKLNPSVMVMRLVDPPTVGVQIKPKRSLIVLLSTITGFFCSVFLAFVLEFFRNLNIEDRTRIGEIKAAFRGKN